MKRLIGIALVGLLLAVAFNDFGRWFTTGSALRDTTNQLTAWAASNAGGLTRDKAAQELANQAAAQGATLYGYTQDVHGMQVWTRAEVKGTWVLGTYLGLTRGKTLKDARTTPVTVTDSGSATFR